MFARKGSVEPAIVEGPVRVDRRTKNLVNRAWPGEIAVIDHEDIDRIAAEQLIARKVAGVVNAAASISGRYPTEGPLLLAAAGIPIIDCVGPDVMHTLRDGMFVRLEGHEVWAAERLVAKGVRQTLESIELEYEAAKRRLGDELGRFAVNTLEYLREEHHLVLDSLPVPALRTRFQGRQVLIVVRGHDYKEDLAALRPYVKEMRPVLVGVDGGADALLENDLEPDIIIGDFDSVSNAALTTGAELVVHAYKDGDAPGAERLDGLGLKYHTFEAPGTSEDIAMLLAYELGAELLVAVGTHVSMVEFLDKGRAGMASTFLVRLKLQHLLVDARGVSSLYKSRVRKRDLFLLLASAMLCVIVLMIVAYPLRVFFDGFRLMWTNMVHWLRN